MLTRHERECERKHRLLPTFILWPDKVNLIEVNLPVKLWHELAPTRQYHVCSCRMFRVFGFWINWKRLFTQNMMTSNGYLFTGIVFQQVYSQLELMFIYSQLEHDVYLFPGIVTSLFSVGTWCFRLNVYLFRYCRKFILSLNMMTSNVYLFTDIATSLFSSRIWWPIMVIYSQILQ